MIKLVVRGDLLNQWEGQNELITSAVSLKLYPFLHKANRSMTLGWVRRGCVGGGGGEERYSWKLSARVYGKTTVCNPCAISDWKCGYFFHPQSDTTYRLILDFTNPTMILSIMLHRLLIPKEKPPWNKSL